MNKKVLFAALTATTMALTACNNSKTGQAKDADSTIVAKEEPTREYKAVDAQTFFTTIQLGMTPEEVSLAMETLPSCDLEWEGLTIHFNFEAMTFDPDTNKLVQIDYYTDNLGTGEYYFAGNGKFQLFEEKEGALTYNEVGVKLEKLAKMIAKATDGIASDCNMQSYSYMGDLGCGTIMADYYNAEKHNVTMDGTEYELGQVYLVFSLTTPERYAS